MFLLALVLSLGFNIFSKENLQQDSDNGLKTSISNSADSNQKKTAQEIKIKNKKILILYSDGGSCHKAATAALKELLDGCNYDIHSVNFFKDVAGSIDTVKSLTFGYISCEDAYNKMLSNGWNTLVNYYAMGLAPILMEWKENDIKTLAKDYFKNFGVDLVISTIPMINHSAGMAAKELNIPYIILTLDCELKTWLYGFSKPDFYEKMSITLWNDNEQTRERLKEHFVPENKIRHIGFPVRKQFFEEKNISELKKTYGVPEDKFVIMIMIGGAGGTATYRYAKKIISMNIPVHIIACAGKNERIIRKLNRLKPNNQVSITSLGFTQNISDIMAISNLLITKPGPGTLNEAIQMELPVLIDSTGTALFWEKPHIDLIKNNNFGDSFSNIQEFESKILELISKPKEEVKNIYANKSKITPAITREKLVNLIEESFSPLLSRQLVSTSQPCLQAPDWTQPQ